MSLLAQDIIAHRGASYLAPENTLAAVRLGYVLGADAVEIDIHLTKDNQLVVIHDKSTGRTATGPNLVVKETEAAALRELEVGSWKGEQYRGEKIPLLGEVLAEVPEGKKLVIEMKTGPEILPHLVRQLKESGIESQLVLISFDRACILEAKQLMPHVPAYWLLHNWAEHSLEEALQIAKAGNLEGLDVHYKLVNRKFMEKMRAHGLEVLVYTVNEAKVGKVLVALGVQGITTDRPQWLREQLSLKPKE